MLKRLRYCLLASVAANVGLPAQTTAPVVAPVVAPPSGKSIQVRFASSAVVQARLNEYKGDDGTREIALRQLFRDAGCAPKDLIEQAVPHQQHPNIICTLPGTGPDTIVVGAHYDHIAAGDGIVDNWSGAALLPSLLQSLVHQPRAHTFIFVAFTGEEDGLVGSDYYVSKLRPDELDDIQVMVNLDTLGLGPTLVWGKQSDPLLVLGLHRMAVSMDLPLDVVNPDGFGQSDEESFLRKKVCALVIHSITPETAHVLHHKEDNLSTIRFDDYYATYRLVAAYLTRLDQDPLDPRHMCKAKAFERSGFRGTRDRWRNFPNDLGRLLY
jgi:hypothetical protein